MPSLKDILIDIDTSQNILVGGIYYPYLIGYDNQTILDLSVLVDCVQFSI